MIGRSIPGARTGDNGRRIGAGRAAWYQHAGRTASGEKFDPNKHTAAHHTLPFGTRVRVVHEQTGRSVTVRINDRIPRKATILIDLSRASAQAIGLAGVGQVSLYQLDRAPGIMTDTDGERTTASRRQAAGAGPSVVSDEAPSRSRPIVKHGQTAKGFPITIAGQSGLRKSAGRSAPSKVNGDNRVASRSEKVSAAAPVYLPESLAPTDWLGSLTQPRAFLKNVGWVNQGHSAAVARYSNSVGENCLCLWRSRFRGGAAPWRYPD